MAAIPHPSGEALKVSDRVFAADNNPSLLAQAVVRHLAGARQGTKATKNRSAVRGGGRKPWRQKKTGRARHGTRRSPLWRTGGHTFALQPRDFSQKFPRKMFVASVRCALSECLRSGRLSVVDSIKLGEPRVKAFVAWAKTQNLDPSQPYLLVVVGQDEATDDLVLATRNLVNIAVVKKQALNAYDLLRAKRTVLSKKVIAEVEAWLG